MLLCLLNSLWHKSSSIILVNQNLKASFLFLCLISARYTRNKQQWRQQENMPFPKCCRSRPWGSGCQLCPGDMKRTTLRLPTDTSLCTVTSFAHHLERVWQPCRSPILNHFTALGSAEATTTVAAWPPMVTYPASSSFKQLQAASRSHKLQCLPSTFPQYSWRKRVSPGSKSSHSKTGKLKVPNSSLLRKELGWLNVSTHTWSSPESFPLTSFTCSSFPPFGILR